MNYEPLEIPFHRGLRVERQVTHYRRKKDAFSITTFLFFDEDHAEARLAVKVFHRTGECPMPAPVEKEAYIGEAEVL